MDVAIDEVVALVSERIQEDALLSESDDSL